jgi:CRP/FNR family nitrogen fixation transcriptional regulator
MTAQFQIEPRFRTSQGGPQVAHEALPANPLSDLFAMSGATLRLARNEELYGEDEPAEYAYQVVSGTVRTCRFSADGHRQIGAFHGKGDVFGLGIGETHRFAAEAVTDATVLMVRRSLVMTAATRDVALAQALWVHAAAEIARIEEHSLLLGRRSAGERVASFLLDSASRSEGGVVELPMSRQDIADYLGLTIETISRTLTQFERDRLIRMQSARRIGLASGSALEQLAQGS